MPKQSEKYKAAVLTVSDRCSKGEREDESGKLIRELIKKAAFKTVKYEVIPDEPRLIKVKLINYADILKVDLVLTTGGTGFSPRDFTPEATKEIIEKETPGIAEAMRIGSSKFSQRAMLSRGIAGLRGKTLIINLPGSPRAVKEFLEVIMDTLPHAIDMLAGQSH